MLQRLNTSLHRFYYKHFSRTKWKVVRFFGAEFVMQPSNYIDRRMWIEGGYENLHLTYMLNQARTHDFDAFLDIGANFGLYSCILGANKVIPIVHSFECDPRNLSHLQGHIRMNSLLDDVTVHPHAVGDVAGSITFRMASGNSTGHSFVAESSEDYSLIHSEKNSKEYRSITVEQKPIDDVLSYTGKELLIKIDVEGYEKIALKGMTRTLRDNTCLLQIEIINGSQELTEMLFTLGYERVHRIDDDWYFSNQPKNSSQ
ncbi:FkbM family methyltransferase [Kiloniella sp.]|uniref:FkbM family methyltransferase n=1 Tax=Kiloniella sp. TaxID=1938587 RepID=UPI003B014FC9